MIGKTILGDAMRGIIMNKAQVYEQTVTIPTYQLGELEKNPLFIENAPVWPCGKGLNRAGPSGIIGLWAAGRAGKSPHGGAL